MAAGNFRLTNLNKNSLERTLKNWIRNPFKNPILNCLWKLTLGFILWNLWKERNNKIFNENPSLLDVVWKQIHSNIQETLNLANWSEEDFKCNSKETEIWENWRFFILISPNTPKKAPFSQSPSTWLSLPSSFTKLNFDGASKGNPGPVGLKGILRDHLGNILHIYSHHLGHDTNNGAELSALLEGLRIAKINSHNNLIIEGDSAIIINMCQRIIHGTPPEETTHS